MINMKMSDGGRVVIPAEIRRALGIHDGDTVLWSLQDGAARLTTRTAQLRQAQASIQALAPAEQCWSDELIAQRRAEARNE